MILFVTYAFAALVIAAYIWFLTWRARTKKRREEIAAAPATTTIPPLPSSPMPRPAPGATSPASPPSPTAPMASGPAPAAAAAPLAAAPGATTIIEMLAGIQLPLDLAPITMLEPRDGTRDHLAFWTDATPADSVGTAFGNELERLGFELSPIDPTVIAADRDRDHLMCKIHLEAQLVMAGKRRTFPAVPDGATVIEVWIPA